MKNQSPEKPKITGIREARMAVLVAALSGGDAWKCSYCGSINGQHIQQCSDCRRRHEPVSR